MIDKSNVMGLAVDKVNLETATNKVLSFISNDTCDMVFTPNAEIAWAALKDDELSNILNSASLLLPDGAGLVIASKIIGDKLKNKVAGVELVNNLLRIDNDSKPSFFFLGGKPGIAKKAAENYSGTNVLGIHDGYFNKEDEVKIIDNINSKQADILLVGLGVPRQEKWIFANRNKLNVKVAIGVGGAFDVLSGEIKRAPKLMIKLNLEWLHRLILEPRRIKRMIVIPLYLLRAIFIRIFNTKN